MIAFLHILAILFGFSLAALLAHDIDLHAVLHPRLNAHLQIKSQIICLVFFPFFHGSTNHEIPYNYYYRFSLLEKYHQMHALVPSPC